MTCREFLAQYSEYLDERLMPAEDERWQAHVAWCRSCARYDQVLRTGLERVRELPEIEPSPDFLPRLQHRLYHLHDGDLEAGNRASGGSAALALAVAAVLTLLAWSPLVRTQIGGPPTAGEADPREVAGTDESTPRAVREVPTLSPGAVVPYGPPTWSDGLVDQRRADLGRRLMLESGSRGESWVGPLSRAWEDSQVTGSWSPDFPPPGFGSAGFALPGALQIEARARIFGFPGSGPTDFETVRLGWPGFGSFGFPGTWGTDGVGPHSPLIIGPPAFRDTGEWVDVAEDEAYAPAMR